MHKAISGLLWALLFAVGEGEAAGLGKLSVQSALGQPLRAEIELLSVNKDELSGISVHLAEAEAFRQARIDRVAALSDLSFSVEQRSSGQPVIRVRSSEPIADPFLDMLLEVDWSSGRLLREYTVLLDPPGEAQPAPVATLPETAVQSAAIMEQPPEKPAARSEPAIRPTSQRYGPVKPGETLREIAARLRPAALTQEQMMVGLYRANRGAFFADNMNRLKRGHVLQVPDSDAVNLQVSPPQASGIVADQAAQWSAYRRKIAGMAAEVATAPPTGKLTASNEPKNVPAAPAARDLLKLSRGERAGADAKTQEKLQALEEELAAKGRSLQEAQDRVSQLERTVRDMQKLLELRAQQDAKTAPPPLPAPVAAPVPHPVVKPVAAAVKVPVRVPVPAPEPSPSWLSTFISSPFYLGGIVAALLLSALLWMMMVGKRRRHGLNKFEDSIMTGGEFKHDHPLSPAAAAGGETEGSVMLADFSRLGLGAIDSHEVDPIAEAEVYMAYGRDAQAEEILKEALNKDPGRHEIALKLLEIYASRKDAVAFETVAGELYAAQGGGLTPVWQHAAEMGRSIDESNPLYRVTELPSSHAGHSPDAAAMDFAPEASPVADLGGSMDFEPTMPSTPPAGAEVHPEVQVDAQDDFVPEFDAPMPSDPALLASLSEEPGWGDEDEVTAEIVIPAVTAMQEAEAPAAALQDLEIESAPAFDEAVESTLGQEPPPPLDLSGIDLELTTLEPDILELPAEFELPVVKPAPEIPVPAQPEIEVSEEEFEPMEEIELLAEPEPVEAPTIEPAIEAIDPELWEEVNTKLDLARAYLEMGDHEGAREILEEVQVEGDSKQKSDADKLLSEAV